MNLSFSQPIRIGCVTTVILLRDQLLQLEILFAHLLIGHLLEAEAIYYKRYYSIILKTKDLKITLKSSRT